jgi:hypothetical protein
MRAMDFASAYPSRGLTCVGEKQNRDTNQDRYLNRYASFNQARDDFARDLDRQTFFKSAGFVVLENAIVGDPNVTTGDHGSVRFRELVAIGARHGLPARSKTARPSQSENTL